MGKKFNEWTNQEKELMVNLHNQGLLNRELAARFNTSTTMISRILRSLHVPSRHPWLSDKRKMEIVDCYKNHQSLHVVSKMMHCSNQTISDLLKEFNVKQISQAEQHRIYEIDEDYFNIIDTPNKAYVLGILFADGNVSKKGNYITISLQERDKDVLDALNKEYGGNRKLSFLEYSKKNKNWQNQYCLTVASKKMHDDIIRQGAMPQKSLNLRFPKYVPDELIRHFVRGYFDGDGNLAKKEDRCSLISTVDFCEQLADIVSNVLNIHATIMYCHGREDKTTRTFQIAGKCQVKAFLDWIYEDADIYMERKYSLYLSKYYTDNSLSA